ncbi:MAG: hypothetical protein DDT40_00632 [candidate division WS2 bacterium]|nr:hypothetical protein [Candidatus Psychracetigena formicireducens]
MFFATDRGIKAEEPPRNMLMSMGLTAFLCLFIGIYPAILYNILPYPVDFVPYTTEKVVEKIALLSFTLLGFWLLKDKIAGQPTISLDTDWFYRKAGPAFMWFCRNPASVFASWKDLAYAKICFAFILLFRHNSPELLLTAEKRVIQSRERRQLASRQPAPLDSLTIGFSIFMFTFIVALFLLLLVFGKLVP